LYLLSTKVEKLSDRDVEGLSVVVLNLPEDLAKHLLLLALSLEEGWIVNHGGTPWSGGSPNNTAEI
jgi:hypothetical protein